MRALSSALFFFALLNGIASSVAWALPPPHASKKPSKERLYAESKNQNFTDLSLEQLLEEEIVSASKYPQKLLLSPSAISVLTGEDIEKSGTLDLEELLRFMPGMLVVKNHRSKNLQYEVFTRGYPQSPSGRLLVLLDGIPIYNPESSSTPWSSTPIPLSAIERVEIIRGPSSTLYGANAFSGTLNIVTKKIATQPTVRFLASGGNLGTTQQELVWDHPLSDQSRFRLSGIFRRESGDSPVNGLDQFNGQTTGQAMFDLETDFSASTKGHFYLYDKGGRIEEISGSTVSPVRGSFNQLFGGFRFTHKIAERNQLSFQSNYSNFHQDTKGISIPVTAEQQRHDVNSELQYIHHFGERDTLVTGTMFRFIHTDLPEIRNQRLLLANFFINNDFKIRPNLILTTGGRYEYDSFTQHQVSGRANLTYAFADNQAIRFSAARAVRTPSLREERTVIDLISGGNPPPLPPIVETVVQGNQALKPESVLAFEFGYNGAFFKNRLQTNFQFYFNRIDNFINFGLKNFDLTALPFPKVIIESNNVGHGEVFGTDVDLQWQALSFWKIGLNYSFTEQRGYETSRFPKHLLNFKNRIEFKNGFLAELLFNWTSSYRYFSQDVNNIGPIPRLDIKVAKKFLNRRFEIGVVGQNLIGAHDESVRSLLVNNAFFREVPNKVDRRIYGTLQYNFGGEKK